MTVLRHSVIDREMSPLRLISILRSDIYKSHDRKYKTGRCKYQIKSINVFISRPYLIRKSFIIPRHENSENVFLAERYTMLCGTKNDTFHIAIVFL